MKLFLLTVIAYIVGILPSEKPNIKLYNLEIRDVDSVVHYSRIYMPEGWRQLNDSLVLNSYTYF